MTTTRIVTVLNVDDNEAGRYATTRILRAAGYDVVEASTGTAGLEAARTHAPDLIILDVHLPDRSGFEVARDLKADEATSGIPVLQMSAAYRDPQDRVRGLDEGADAYLTQPVTAKELVATVRALLRMRHAEREVRDSEQRLHAVVEGIADFVWTADPVGRPREPVRWAEFTGCDARALASGWTVSVHPSERDAVDRTWRSAIVAQTPFVTEARVRRPDGSFRWLALRAVPVRELSAGDSGRVREWVGIAMDVDVRRRQSDLAAFLSRAGELLASSLEYETTLASVVGLAVPALADWCAVDVSDDRGLRRIAVRGDAPGDVEPDHAASQVMERGTPLLLTRAIRPSPDDARVASWLGVPMAARGHTFGTLSLATGPSGRRLEVADLEAAQELARRAAMAIENARLYEAAREANRAKSHFLATMSHELRTPLNAILGYADLLESGITVGPDGRDLNQLARIKSSARHLITLIDGVLVFSRFEAGKESLAPVEVDARDLAREAASYLERLAVEKGLRFDVVLPEAPAPMETDRGKLLQVLLNLLSNAVKFTRSGRVALGLEVDGDELIFRVSDTGVGIAKADLARIFEPFWQVGSAGSGSVGTGLGLSVSQHLVTFMGGTITVESQPGSGTTFIARLPRRLPDQGVAASSSGAT